MDFKRLGVAMVIAGCVLAAGWVVMDVRLHQRWVSPCIIRGWTGWYCVACGMTRALRCLCHGDWLEAVRYNPLGVVLYPMLGLGTLWDGWRWVRHQPSGFWARLGWRGAWVILALMLTFMVLRNLPGWPFTLLAPP